MRLSSTLFAVALSRLAELSAAKPRVLIYFATKGFRHDSIPTAIDVLKSRQNTVNVEFDTSEDPTRFRDDILAEYDALLFLSTTGEVLDDTGKAAFQTYLNRGGNFIGVHSASDTLINTTAYTQELGAVFDYHADLQPFTTNVIGPSHPSTAMLPAQWKVQDECYNFKSDPRELGAVVVLSADESTVKDPGPRRFNQGTPHPLAWYQERGAGVQQGGIPGRSFYTSLGHLNETWRNETFVAHVLGGVAWAVGSNTTKATNTTAFIGNAGTPQSVAPSRATRPSPYDILLRNPVWTVLGTMLALGILVIL